MSSTAVFFLSLTWLLIVITVTAHWWGAVAWLSGFMLIVATAEIVSQVKKAATGGGQ